MKMKNKILCTLVFTSSENKNCLEKDSIQQSLTNYSEVSEPSSSSSSSSAVRNTLMSRGEPAEAPLGTSTVVVISLSSITLSWVQYLKCSKEENTTPVSVLYTFYYILLHHPETIQSQLYNYYSVFSCNKKQLLLLWCLNDVHPPNIFPAAIFTAPLCLQFSSSLAYRSIGRRATTIILEGL